MQTEIHLDRGSELISDNTPHFVNPARNNQISRNLTGFFYPKLQLKEELRPPEESRRKATPPTEESVGSQFGLVRKPIYGVKGSRVELEAGPIFSDQSSKGGSENMTDPFKPTYKDISDTEHYSGLAGKI